MAFTDGLVEDRQRSVFDGIDELADVLRRRREVDPERLADILLEEMGRARCQNEDDIALLLIATG